MTEEEKIAAEEAAKKEAELSNTDIEEALKEEREKRIEAENALEETRRKAKERIEEKKRKEQELAEEEDKPLTRKEMESLLAEREEQTRKAVLNERANEIAKKLVEDPSEAELVLEVWKNRTLSGTLEEQISEAHAIATYRRTQKVNGELKRALAAKDGVSLNGSQAQRKPDTANEPKINPVDKTALAGFTWDGARGAYKKTIAKGRKTFYVSRDLTKRWVE